MNLENELKLALRRKEPVRDFSRSFAPKPSHKGLRLPVRIAAGFIILALIPYGLYERRQAEGREAKQRLMVALELAGSKVLKTQKLLRNNAL